MHHASNVRWQMTDDRSRTNKTRSNQNAREKGNLEILGDIGGCHYQTCGNGRKTLKK